MISDPALEFIDVCHHYGNTSAVQGFSLELAEGELVCLLGPSGCGKTTTLRLAAGLEVLQCGEIRIGGNPVAKSRAFSVPPEERDVGLVFQDYALFPHLTVNRLGKPLPSLSIWRTTAKSSVSSSVAPKT